MTSSMYVPICNRIHISRDHSGKTRTSRDGTPVSRPRSRGTSSPKSIKFRHDRVFGAANSKDFVILACTILIQYSSVTDRQLDRRPGHSYDAQSILLSCIKNYRPTGSLVINNDNKNLNSLFLNNN